MDGELETVPFTYSFVISLGKSDRDGYSLDFEMTWETWGSANRCISTSRNKCEVIYSAR